MNNVKCEIKTGKSKNGNDYKYLSLSKNGKEFYKSYIPEKEVLYYKSILEN